MTEQPATSRTETPMADGYQTREEAEQRIEELRSEVERLRAERARAVEALGSIGRTAVAATGDLEAGINAELIARERAEAERDEADRRAAHHEDRAEKLGRQLRATRAERQQAEAERDRLAEQVKRAEDVCVLLGWTASPMDTDRTKALHQLWSEWVRTKPDGYMDPANHPDLSDEVIERLAHKRDEIRARTLAAVRDDGTEAGQ